MPREVAERPSRKDEILGAARKLFVERGVAGTSVREIAREVGFTEGAIYRHFTSKDEIVTTLFELEAQAFHDHLARHGEETGSHVEGEIWHQMDCLVHAFLTYGRTRSESLRLINLLHSTPGIARGQARLPRHQFIKAIDRITRHTGRSVADPVAVVVMIAGALNRLIDAERQEQVSLAAEDLAALAMRTVRAMVEAALAPARGGRVR